MLFFSRCLRNFQQKDPYSILGVPRSATTEELRKKYLEFAKKYHPDRNKDNPEAVHKFKEIQEAYESIKDGSYEESQRRQPPPGADYYTWQEYQRRNQSGPADSSAEYARRRAYGAGNYPNDPRNNPNNPGGTHADWRVRMQMEQQRRLQEEMWRRQRMNNMWGRSWFNRGGSQFNSPGAGGYGTQDEFNNQQNPQEMPTDPRVVDRMFVLWPVAFIILLLLRGTPGQKIFIDEKGRAVSFDGYAQPTFHPELDVELAPNVQEKLRKEQKARLANIEEDMLMAANSTSSRGRAGAFMPSTYSRGIMGAHYDETPRLGMHSNPSSNQPLSRTRSGTENKHGSKNNNKSSQRTSTDAESRTHFDIEIEKRS
ncbi:unnamed protein product [Amoebophrya sp. A120]|nr:unnamed protein product [Amoebophrya sp. A120]|eukprot:GSA120T00012250001.1